MANTPVSSSLASPVENNTCHLLRLPIELQLYIYELAVVENEPLLLNCPCNSSYRGARYSLYKEVQEQWESGQQQAPSQPALTQTCRFIREEALPVFYRENVFRACYCSDSMLPSATQWLRRIGPKNRETMRHLYFYDRNSSQDRRPMSFDRLLKGEIFNEMGGVSEHLRGDHACTHLIAFGGWKRKDGKVPLALLGGGRRLRISGEI